MWIIQIADQHIGPFRSHIDAMFWLGDNKLQHLNYKVRMLAKVPKNLSNEQRTALIALIT